jgi:hypothetical protein
MELDIRVNLILDSSGNGVSFLVSVFGTVKCIDVMPSVDRRQLCNLPVKETTGDSQQPGPDIEIYRLGVQLFERSL